MSSLFFIKYGMYILTYTYNFYNNKYLFINLTRFVFNWNSVKCQLFYNKLVYCMLKLKGLILEIVRLLLQGLYRGYLSSNRRCNIFR